MNLPKKKSRPSAGNVPSTVGRSSDMAPPRREITSATAADVAVPATPGRQNPPIQPIAKAYPVKETTMDDNKKRALAVALGQIE